MLIIITNAQVESKATSGDDEDGNGDEDDEDDEETRQKWSQSREERRTNLHFACKGFIWSLCPTVNFYVSEFVSLLLLSFSPHRLHYNTHCTRSLMETKWTCIRTQISETLAVSSPLLVSPLRLLTHWLRERERERASQTITTSAIEQYNSSNTIEEWNWVGEFFSLSPARRKCRERERERMKEKKAEKEHKY